MQTVILMLCKVTISVIDVESTDVSKSCDPLDGTLD